MPKVTFEPSGTIAEALPGAELLDVARKAGVEVESPCGGKGTCGKCIVRITQGKIESEGRGALPPTMIADGYVLACKTHLLTSDITVEVPRPSGREGGQFADGDETYLIRRELLPREWEYDPLAVKWLFLVPQPQPEDGLSDLDRLTRAIQLQWGRHEVVYSLRVLRTLAGSLRAKDGAVTVTLVREDDKLYVIRIEPGNQTTRHYAIAVDVGTTTVAVQLINLTVARIMSTHTAYNGQVVCGLDIISRINYAKRPERLEELRMRVLDTINTLITKTAEENGVEPEEITNAVISGNTTMNHLLLGLDPEYIRLDPYTPTVLEVPYVTAAEVGLPINPDSWICFSPNNGSYVGGDITAGLLCTDLAAESEEISLFIDIGTNGELVVGNSDFLMSCACSAGPAFEGGGIQCGMRAAHGAIESVDVDPDTGAARYHTIGGGAPQGICGSGMIELLANLFITGWLNPAGKLDRDRPSPYIKNDGKRARYIIASAEESANGEAIAISEMDIENIVRAKGAIYSACSLMLQHIGIGFEDLARIYIAGGFGRFLDLEKTIILGLAPDIPRERFQYIGNASLMGSYMVAVSQEYRKRQLDIARRMTYMDLSNTPGYMDEYMASLFLPHTDMNRFPSVQARMQ